MASITNDDNMTANDQFEAYFTEKIWEMIPAFFREEDGLAEPPGVLRGVVKILARQAAVLRRSNDRLWDDQFIDLCDSWAVPYLADLVGTRLVSSLNPRGRRIDVAKTIYYRRRKGTVRVLEELISDITGWDGVVVEEFRRLARAWHGLDLKPTSYAGRFTGTAPGGYADLRLPRGSELAGGPFDEYFHSPDLRLQRGRDGLYNIPKLAFHLYRLTAFPLAGVTPMEVPVPGMNGRAYTFDPSGRDVPLFSHSDRDEAFDWEQWRSAREWELPAPIRCRVLNHAEYLVTEAMVLRLIANQGLSPFAATDLRKLRGERFPSESRLHDALGRMPNQGELLGLPIYDKLREFALVDDCGKMALLSGSIQIITAPSVAKETITSGKLVTWTIPPTSKELVIDPERGRLLFTGAAPPPVPNAVAYCYGFSAPMGAGSYDRSGLDANKHPFVLPHPISPLSNNAPLTTADIDAGTPVSVGVTELADSSTFVTFGTAADKSGIQNTQIQGRNQQRPYLRLDGDWTLEAQPGLQAKLVIEGVWIGTSSHAAIILAGNYDTVTIRHSTLDPGGTDALGNTIASLPIVVSGHVERLVIERSITASIRLNGGSVKQLMVSDSIIQSIDPKVPAIELPNSRLDIDHTTVFGSVIGDRLYASEALFVGSVDIADTQDGCFRFSAAIKGSRVPQPYRSLYIDDAAHFFTSRRFGDSGYAQLSQSAPQNLLTGAENGSEIGAFSGQLNPIRLDGLRAKVDEYMPFGLIPVFLFES